MRCENHGYSDTFEASRLAVETAFAKFNGATVITRQLEKSLSKLGEVNPDGCADFIQGISKLKNDILLLADENAKLLDACRNALGVAILNLNDMKNENNRLRGEK